mgnify:CR=1 FL=1
MVCAAQSRRCLLFSTQARTTVLVPTRDLPSSSASASAVWRTLAAICSRTGSGVVDRNVEVNDDKLGFIAGMELNAQKARILLMLSLTKNSDAKKLQEYFYQY